MGVAPRCERDRFKNLRPRVPSPETTFFWPLDLTGAVEGVERGIVTPEQRIGPRSRDGIGEVAHTADK